MRKIVAITLIMILTVALAGCGRVGNITKQNSATPQTIEQAGAKSDPQTSSAANTTSGSTTNQAPGGTAIVAKSSNIVSSSEKEELLHQVDQELDSLFNNINSLEDVQDSDLDLNQ